MSFMIWQRMEQSFSDSEQLQAALFLFVEAIKCADSANAKTGLSVLLKRKTRSDFWQGGSLSAPFPTERSGALWTKLLVKENKVMRNDLEEDQEWK